MFPTKDGAKSFGSKFKSRRYDEFHDKSEGASPKSTSRPEGEPSKPKEPKEMSRTNEGGEAKFSKAEDHAEPNDVKAEPEGVDAGAVAAEHGPATHVTVHHDHAANRHHVVSHHPDGHLNTSDHESAQDAHDAAAQLGGGAEGEPTENNAGAAFGEAEGDGFNDGFKTPKLA